MPEYLYYMSIVWKVKTIFDIVIIKTLKDDHGSFSIEKKAGEL